MIQGLSLRMGSGGKALLGLGLLVALVCAGLVFERDGGAPVATVNTAAVVPTSLVNVSSSVKARVDKSVARVNRLKVSGSPAVAKQKVRAFAKTEVDKAIADAKERLGAKASQFSIGAIVCPILQALRAAFGSFFGGIFNALLVAFGCVPAPSGAVAAPVNNAPVNNAPTTGRPQRVRPIRRPGLTNRRPALTNRRPALTNRLPGIAPRRAARAGS